MTTTDADEIAGLDADCVLYCARDFGDWRADDVLIRLLESGKNVITSLAYFRAESRAPEVIERLENACQRGGSSLHASGINPGYVGERLGVILTGFSHDLEQVKIEEFFDITPLSEDLAHLLGDWAADRRVGGCQCGGSARTAVLGAVHRIDLRCAGRRD